MWVLTLHSCPNCPADPRSGRSSRLPLSTGDRLGCHKATWWSQPGLTVPYTCIHRRTKTRTDSGSTYAARGEKVFHPLLLGLSFERQWMNHFLVSSPEMAMRVSDDPFKEMRGDIGRSRVRIVDGSVHALYGNWRIPPLVVSVSRIEFNGDCYAPRRCRGVL